MNIVALMIGWILLGCASAFILSAVFFGVKEEKNLEESENDL